MSSAPRQLDMLGLFDAPVDEPTPAEFAAVVEPCARQVADERRAHRRAGMQEQFGGGYTSQSGAMPDDGGEPGWLRLYLLAMDRRIWGRWDWWLDVLMSGDLPADPADQRIPQIEWWPQPHEPTCKMLRNCVEHLQASAGLHSWEATRYLVQWIGHGLRGTPIEGRRYDKAERLLKRDFVLGLLQLFPYDYMGWMLSELGWGKRNGFFPTPLPLAQVMADLIMDPAPSAEALRTVETNDCAVGTGRLLMVASNRCLLLSGNDIDETALTACRVNMWLYAPWGAMPHHGWHEAARSAGAGEVSP